MSMPGVGIKTVATILLTVGDAGTFTSRHLAAYAGIAPVTRSSGSSIRGEFPARSGNKQPKDALFRSAWIANCHHPASKAYYQKKRAQGKKRNAAAICLARRRCDAIYSMLKHGTPTRKTRPGRLTKSIGTPPRSPGAPNPSGAAALTNDEFRREQDLPVPRCRIIQFLVKQFDSGPANKRRRLANGR